MAKQPSVRQIGAIKAILFVLCLLPLMRLAWGVWQDALGATPIEFIQR